jgi:phosphopantothenoylcysteine decarboxylase/phosphopantothenate--cysteine ligase
MVLKNKNILLGVTGSISIYKALELIRLYIKAGANVKVIMTSSAKKFITPLSFETISRNTILDDLNEDWSTNTNNNHIAIGKWADIFVIAPCTANTINKLAYGVADTILTQSMLAYPGIKLLAPAANTNMLHCVITQDNLQLLEKANYKFVQTSSKELACQDVGDGALADIETIFHQTIRELYKDSYWEDREVVLNGGASIEKIDDVRYISNFSSGKMANSLALSLYYKGANVHYVKFANVNFNHSHFIKTYQVTNTKESLQVSLDIVDNITTNKKPYFFGVAAISDYIVKDSAKGKLKKSQLGENWSLDLVQNIDILSSLQDKEIYKIGFKAEYDEKKGKNNAMDALKNKNLDAICLNFLTKNNFGSETNEIEVIQKEDSVKLEKASKLDIANSILQILQKKHNGN